MNERVIKLNEEQKDFLSQIVRCSMAAMVDSGRLLESLSFSILDDKIIEGSLTQMDCKILEPILDLFGEFMLINSKLVKDAGKKLFNELYPQIKEFIKDYDFNEDVFAQMGGGMNS